MYTVRRMKGILTVLLLMEAVSAWASQPMLLSLPPVEKADAEVVTNVPLPALSRRAGRFAFSLGCHATPTNNVEIAFGADADEDGVLAPRETRLVMSNVKLKMENENDRMGGGWNFTFSIFSFTFGRRAGRIVQRPVPARIVHGDSEVTP